MQPNYRPASIEQQMQQRWESSQAFRADEHYGKLQMDQVRNHTIGYMRKQVKRPGFDRRYAGQPRRLTALFAETGLFVRHTAWLNPRKSR